MRMRIRAWLFKRIKRIDRATAIAIWGVGSGFWALSIIGHHWNSQFQLVAADVGLATLVLVSLSTVTQLSASDHDVEFRKIFVCWYAAFGLCFCLDTFLKLPDLAGAALYIGMIALLAWARWRYCVRL